MGRISNLETATDLTSSDYIAIDDPSGYTSRYLAKKLETETVLEKTPWITKAIMYPDVMVFQKDLTSLAPSTSDNSTATSKTLSTAEFYPTGVIGFYHSNVTLGANNRIPDGSIKIQTVVDLRKSFNIKQALTANQAVFLACERSGSGGKVKFVASSWYGTDNLPIIQNLPSAWDGRYYIYLGNAVDSYSIQLTPFHPIYMYAGGIETTITHAENATNAWADSNGNEIASSYMPFKGQFTGTIDATDIAPGVYYLDAYSITINGTATSYYGTFIQFPGTYKAQAIFASPAASAYGGMLTRRYYTSTTSWSSWMSDIWHKGNLPIKQLSPTAATISGVTFNRSYFYRMGPIVYCQANLTLSSGTTVPTNTNLFTGLPAAVGTTDMPFVYTGGNANRSVYINSVGQLKTSGSTTAGTWVFNGWYYTTAS